MVQEIAPQPETESGLRARLDASPNDFPALIRLAMLLLRERRRDEGLAVLERAAKLNPGHAAPFTLKAITLFRQHFGAPPPPRAMPAGAKAVSMRQLGSNGKFGNQLLQYGFLRLYAAAHGLVAQTPDWIGRDLFAAEDPFPDAPFPVADEANTDLFALLGDDRPVLADHDLVGFFCRPTTVWGARAGDFRALYRPASRIEPILQQAQARLRERGRTVVGIHLRRGDFGYGPFWIAPTDWYRAWLDRIWSTLDAPVLYIASDDPQAVAEFQRFGAVSAATLGVSLPGADFYLDHYLLSQANHLAISNSTFSLTAAMLNARAQSFVRPDPDQRTLVAFEPWNTEPLLQPDPARHSYSTDDEKVITRRISPRGVLVHAGSFCSPWTALIRKHHPHLKIFEMPAEETVNGLRQRHGLKHVNNLVIEEGQDLAAVIAGSMEAIRHARVDAIYFKGDPDAAIAQLLDAHGYRLFAVADGALQPMAQAPANTPRMAIQERLLVKPQQTGLDLQTLCARHKISVRGVIHVGAHEGRELPIYERLGAGRALFIEANPTVFSRLQAAMTGKDHVVTVHRAVADRPGKAELHVTSFDQSSSLLPLARHRTIYPQIVPVGAVSVNMTPLDALLEELDEPATVFNLLAVDVQGAEAMVLKGAAETLSHMDAVSIEVNFTDLYQGAAEIEEIDVLLDTAGFRRVCLVSPYHPSWGDAFYIRK